MWLYLVTLDSEVEIIFHWAAVILSSQFIAPHRADPGAPPDEIYQTTNLYHSRHSQHCEDNFTLTTHNTTQLGEARLGRCVNTIFPLRNVLRNSFPPQRCERLCPGRPDINCIVNQS